MRGDRIRVAQLQQKIADLKQGNRKILDYFHLYERFVGKLDLNRLMPQCTCPIHCTCLAMHNAKGFRAEDKMIQFLISLNEDYQRVASHVVLMDPLPQINRVFSMIMQQERKVQYSMISARATSLEDNTTWLANDVDERGRRNKRIYGFCGKSGYVIKTCIRSMVTLQALV